MHVSSSPIRRLVALAAAFATVMILGGVSPSAAAEEPAGQDKIDPAVLELVSRGEPATFFVVMRREADLSTAEQRRTHARKATAAYDALTATAEDSQDAITDVLDREGVAFESFWIANALLVTSDDESLVERLAARTDVAEIVKERRHRLDVGTTVAAADGEVTDEDVEWGIADVRANEVWSQYGVRGEGIVIANIDSGVQFDHPDLVGGYRGSRGDGAFDHDYNWYDPTGLCTGGVPCDNNGHGTHTMGTMVGAGGLGVAPDATWIAAKGCEARSCSDSSLLAAGQWILAPTDRAGLNPRPDLAPNIVNNSWGGGQTTFYQDIVEAWNAAGIFEAFAAGNDGDGATCSTAASPGAQAPSYAVGAYDANGNIAPFSGFGPSAVDASAKPDIAAPGVAIRSTWPNSSYRVQNGTSMATPHVAGAVALLWAEAPSLIGDIDATRALLGQSAVDVDDTRCGGSAGRNNIWGEGRLDVMAAVDAAPHTSAIVTGTVSDGETGDPIAGVAVTAAAGSFSRTVTTEQDGGYRLTLPAGTYTFTLHSYGYADTTEAGYAVVSGADADKDFALDAVADHAVTGTVLDVTGEPLPGAIVRLAGVPVPETTTDDTGRFILPEVAEGRFTLNAVPVAPVLCNGVHTGEVVVDGDETLTVALPARTDQAGTTCRPERSDWIRGRTDVRLAGDEDVATIALPFPVRLYGESYTSAHVTTNGLVNFLQPRLGDYENAGLPSADRPDGIVAAFWDDLVLDRRSDVQTRTLGRPGARKFAVVWDDAVLADDPSERVSFEVVFEEATGAITMQYDDLGRDAAERGGSATVGLEDATGADGFQYSLDEVVLSDRTAIRFTPGDTAGGADGSGSNGEMIVLSRAEEAELAERVQLDPYGTAAEAAEPEANATADETEAPLELNVRTALEGVQGMARTLPIGGTDGDYFVLNALGNVQRRTTGGETVWERGNPSYYEDWQVTNIRPWQPEAYPARIVMGYNAVGPFSPASDQGVVAGDLSGDGVDDVVFSAEVGSNPYRPFTSPGSPLPTGTFVTVLDGATGDTLWSKLYGAALHLALVDDTLVVADSPSVNVNSPASAPARLTGLRFTAAGDGLTAEEAWNYDAGTTRGMTWGALLPMDGGLLAASWNQRKTSAAAVPSGHTLVLDTADGSVRWSQSDRLYSRQLHLDASRDRLVTLEQSDVNDGMEYAIVGYRLSDGTRTVLDNRINALPLDLVVGDVDGGRSSEYVVSESTLSPSLWLNSNTVRALDGDTGARIWTRTVKRSKGNFGDAGGAWGLTVVDRAVVASYNDDAESDSALNRSNSRFARLAVMDGRTGRVRWEKRGVVASQMWVQPIRTRHHWNLRTVDVDQNIWEYKMLLPFRPDVTPLQGRVWSAVSQDLNGDGTKDLVVGGQSRGLWAYDGTSLTTGEPELLWETTVPGQPQQLKTADVDGDRRQEIVVAADTAAVVVDAQTGQVERTIDGRGQFVRSVATHDLDGDGADEILVPTDALRAYDHRGKVRWSYQAPESAGDVVFADVSFGDGRVYAQYLSRNAIDLADPVAAGVALEGRNGSVVWSFDPEPATTGGRVHAAPLQVGTFASPDIPYADGHAVVYTWQGPVTQPLNQLATFVEIRDGRTGELLLTEQTGGGYTLGNYMTAPEGLVQTVQGSWRVFAGGDSSHRITVLSDIKTTEAATGPDGRRLLVSGGQAGFNLYDASALSGDDFPPVVTGYGQLGVEGYVVTDLEGDGTDEIVTLNNNDMGADRTARLYGGGISTPYTAIRQLAVLTMDPAS